MHPTCWRCGRKFARIVKNMPRIQEPTLLTKNIYLCPYLDYRLPFTCSNTHKFPSKRKYPLRHAYSKVWIHHRMVRWLTPLFQRRRGKAPLFISVDNFHTWHRASRHIVFEWKHTAGKGAHSWMYIARNGFDSCKRLFHSTLLFAEAIQRWSLNTFVM